MVFCDLFVSDTLTMVNPDGFLEDEDTQLSSPRSRRDRLYDRDNSFEDSIPEGDEDDSDGINDVEEIRPTYREPSYEPLDISLAGPSRSGVTFLDLGMQLI